MHGLPPESVGGTELHVAELAAAQAAEHEVAIFARVRDGAPAKLGAVPVHGFRPRERPGTSFLERTDFPEADRAFAEVVAAFRPEVVHVHHLSGLSAGILGIAAGSGARVVLTIHDHALACPRGQRIRLDLDPCPVLDRDRCVRCVRPHWIEAVRAKDRWSAVLGLFKPDQGRRLFAARDAHLFANLDKVAAFIAPSRSAAELFAEFHPPAAGRTRIIPHGLRRDAGAPPAPVPSRPFVVGYFGSLLPSKGIGLLADVARRLDPRQVRIVVNGGGTPAAEAALRRRSEGKIDLRGPYAPDELGARMLAVHAVAVPSLWPETFSIVVREAWAWRRPVLASRTGALVEAAGPAEDRIGLVAPGDVDAWADAFERLASDGAWYARLAGPHTPEPFRRMLDAILACYMGREP